MSGQKEKKNIQKRKKVVISLEEKYSAIRRLNSGETAVALAKELHVGKSTVAGWKKNQHEIEKWCLSREGQSPSKAKNKRKTMKKSEYDKVGEALYYWFVLKREKGVPISGPILREKALKFHEDFEKKAPARVDDEPIDADEKEEFTASDGWLSRWKRRYGIRQLIIAGERLSAESKRENLMKFKRQFHEMIDKEGLSGDQIYNCDETGLYYRMLPEKSLVLQEEKSAPGYKKSKDRVTVLACSNASGSHKLQPLVIGKSVKPRAFKKLRMMSELPVPYKGQKKGWMNSTIFCEWFHEEFVLAVSMFLESQGLPRKAILVLDNAPSHPDASKLQDGDIKVVYLPPNVTAIAQPMDQGALEAFKRKFRRILLSKILAHDNNEEFDLCARLKEIDMLDVLRWTSDAWEEVNSLSIVRSWRKLLDHKATHVWWEQDNENEENEEKEPKDELINEDSQKLLSLVQQIPGCSTMNEDGLQEWMAADNELEMGDEDICELVTNENDGGNGDSDNDDEELISVNQSSITHAAACEMFEKIIPYIEQQEETTASDIILFRKWRDRAAEKRLSQSKQMNIQQFFKKL